MDEILQDFLTEAGELLSDVDGKLVALEKQPDAALLNDVFRGFHTIKGGAGFLQLDALVDVCHLAENVLDQLRRKERCIDATTMDAILAATAAVRHMFDTLTRGAALEPADAPLLAALRSVTSVSATPRRSGDTPSPKQQPSAPLVASEPDWPGFLSAITQAAPAARPQPASGPYGRRASDNPDVDAAPTGRRASDRLAVSRDSTIRVDTSRLDQILALSGELVFARSRLNGLRDEMVAGRCDAAILRDLDESVSRVDLLVDDLQRTIMKARMQPISRLFQRYPRMARDLARTLGKDLELVLEGEEIEVDRTLIDGLADPLIHLVRNAVDHGIEMPQKRIAAGKAPRATVRLSASREGDHVCIALSDDGRGMDPELLRRRACEKGLIEADAAARLDATQCLNLVFLPGFSTKDEVSSVSGRGVGMDVVKTHIDDLNGRVEIESRLGSGSIFRLWLPLTWTSLAVLSR